MTDRKRYSTSARPGCPTCMGVDPESCLRCRGRTRMREWWRTPSGWRHAFKEPRHD